MRRPTPVEPVKLIMSTCGDDTSASDAAMSVPQVTLMTPGGNPASFMISTSLMTASGSCGAGFTTTVLPMASAGPILPAMFTTGKLYDVMQLTTPTGARWPTPPMMPPGASAVVGMTWGSRGMSRDSIAPLA
jgi:hypothetical protein